MLAVAAGVLAVGVDDGERHVAVAAGDPLLGGRDRLVPGKPGGRGGSTFSDADAVTVAGPGEAAPGDGLALTVASSEPSRQLVGIAARLEVDRDRRLEPLARRGGLGRRPGP